MAVFVDDLKKAVIDNAEASDKIVIISGYLSPDMVDEVATLGIPFEFYYGMYGVEKIRSTVLNALRTLVAIHPNMKMNFVHTQRVHTKLYLFYNSGMVFNALVGSANCSTQGLCSAKNAEMLAEVNSAAVTDSGYIASFIDYYNDIKANSIDINDPLVKAAKSKKLKVTKGKKGHIPITSDPLTAIMPLYCFDKKTGNRRTYSGGGPNWGSQSGHTAKKRTALEAYIPILADHIDNYPLLFQPFPNKRTTTGGKSTRKSDPVTVIWDDGTIMTMTFQGGQRYYPSKSTPLMVYPKQLSYGDASTRKGGAVLGKYLRERMNVGPFHVISVKDLDDYGRDHILLRYVSPGLYQADFSGKRFSVTRP